MNVDWEICSNLVKRVPKDWTYQQKLDELGRHCMRVLDPEFPDKVQLGDFVVGGEGTGYGHDHDHACMSLRGAGVGAVICEATNTNFKRNSIHHGLPVIEVKGIMDATATGNELELDLGHGRVTNLTTGNVLEFLPYPEFVFEILEAGGLYPQLERQVQDGAYT